MILLLLVAVLAALAVRFAALPRPVVVAAAREVVPVVRAGNAYAYQYVLKGDDHDAGKLVVRADRMAAFVIVRVAPVDRAGRRTGRSRLLAVVPGEQRAGAALVLGQVQQQTAASTGSVTTLATVFTSAPTSGNLLLCATNSAATVNMSSTGWTLAVSSVDFTGLYLWYKIAGAAESSTVTVAPTTATSVETWIAEYSGNVTSGVLDVTAHAENAGVVINVPSGTTAATAQADELAVAVFGNTSGSDGGGGIRCTFDSYTNGFVELADVFGVATNITQNTDLAVTTKALSATGAQSSTATMSDTRSHPQGLIATFKAAAGGTTQVAATRRVNYNVSANVASTRRIVYSVTSQVASTRRIAYAVSGEVFATRRISYMVGQVVAPTSVVQVLGVRYGHVTPNVPSSTHR